MLFKRISFHNFGLLAGDQTIDLSTDNHGQGGTSIVLIGGQNGAGKTSILEALRLCLYGRLAFGSRMSLVDYHGHLLKRIHRPKSGKEAPDGASILLEFELTSQGHTDTYQIQRSWKRRTEGQDGVAENFLAFKNGAMLDDVEADYWQDFIQGLIPSGLSQLFFFDGEQIQQLADDETDNFALAASVKALLGLEVVERLQTDLSIYAGREIKRNQSQEAAAKSAAAQEEIEQLEGRVDVLQQERAGLQNRFDSARKAIEECERELMQAGQGFYDNREELKRRSAELDAAIGQLEKRLQELCEQELPFALCPDLSKRLKGQLQSEEERQQWEAARGRVRDFAETLLQRAASAVKGDAVGQMQALVTSALEESQTLPGKLQGVEIVHGLSAGDKALVESWIQKATDTLPGTAKGLVDKLEKRLEELRKIQKALTQVPEQDLLKPHMEKLLVVQTKLAELQAKDHALIEQIAEQTRALEQAKRTLAKGEAELKEVEGKDRQLAYAVKTQEVLKKFQTRLTDMKLRRLEDVFVQTFNHLSRKLELSKVTINADTFRVAMVDEEGKALNKTQFSAGEKQIYAMAMLWSLAKISGRSLPVVIDTPLGRLDATHRTKLLERYFPSASHQVIILSTDTEVDQSYFDKLSPYVTRTYHLAHDRNEGMTRVEEGYFWKEAAHA